MCFLIVALAIGCQRQAREQATPADIEPAPASAPAPESPPAPVSPPASVESPTEHAVTGTLKVRVFYRERMRLPATALVKVVLEDSAKMDVRSKVLAEQTVSAQPGPPYEVKLTYATADLNDRGRYTVRARIEENGQLLFTSTQTTPAFGADGSASSPPNDPIELLVRRVTSSPPTLPGNLTGVTWRLTMLNQTPYDATAGAEQPSLEFTEEGSRVSGNSGCNRIAGSYTVEADQLRFGQLIMTKRACVNGSAIERDFIRALEETQRHTISNDKLTLYSGDGRAVAAFQAAAGDGRPSQ